MSDIAIITAPDILYTNEYSILLIHPNITLKHNFQNLLQELDAPTLHVYLYEQNNNPNIEWLIKVFTQVDLCIFDIDNSSKDVRDLAGYFLSRDKTYWLTNSQNSVYNSININKVYELDFLKSKLGGNIETKR